MGEMGIRLNGEAVELQDGVWYEGNGPDERTISESVNTFTGLVISQLSNIFETCTSGTTTRISSVRWHCDCIGIGIGFDFGNII